MFSSEIETTVWYPSIFFVKITHLWIINCSFHFSENSVKWNLQPYSRYFCRKCCNFNFCEVTDPSCKIIILTTSFSKKRKYWYIDFTDCTWKIPGNVKLQMSSAWYYLPKKIGKPHWATTLYDGLFGPVVSNCKWHFGANHLSYWNV